MSRNAPPADTDLAPRLTVTRCVEEYERAVADIKSACATIASAEDRLNSVFTMGGSGRIGLSVYGRVDFHEPGDILDRMRRDVWRSLVERMEVRRMLSCRRARELDEHLRHGELPEVTADAVEQLARQFTAQLPEMLSEAVEEVFSFLRPARNRYKTNTELELGDRVILSHPVEVGYGGNFDVSHWWDDRLTALENVFTALDGKGQISRGYYSLLSSAIKTTPLSVGRGQTDLFEYRCFRNGNLHLRFKRTDLVARLNQIAGDMRLRPADTG